MNKLKSILMLSLLSLIILGIASCDDNLVYEKEGDCSPKVQFVFKKHRQALHQIAGRETDAFYSTVGSVHLFVYDTNTGDLVFEKIENTDNLLSASELGIGSGTDRCYMDLDLEPGTYRFVAWCGLDDADQNNAFKLAESSTRASYTHCEIKIDSKTGRPVSNEKYEGLYHGIVSEAKISFDANSPQIIPVELTKNNNDIAVWIQHTTEKFEAGDYEVVYTDANGTMHFEDNSMQSAERLEFHPHNTSILTSTTEYNGNVMETGALVAHLSTSRLMHGHSKDARLEVRTREGETVFSIPFIDYVLNLQTFTNDGQYYLDCEDTYNCSFYLTGDREKDGLWMPAMIIINNWVVVPKQGTDI